MQAFATLNHEHRSDIRSTNVDDLEPTIWKLESENAFMELLVRNNPSVITDISPNGLLIMTSSAPEVGGHILIPIVFRHYQKIIVRCRVRHVAKYTSGFMIDGAELPEMYQVGVFFEGNKNKKHEQLRILCENLM